LKDFWMLNSEFCGYSFGVFWGLQDFLLWFMSLQHFPHTQ
jgi:hypothetical protein